MKTRGRGRAKPSFIPPPPPPDLRHSAAGGATPTPASPAAAPPPLAAAESSAGVGRSSAAADLLNDRSCQQSAVGAVNCFLAARAVTFLIKTALPSAKDITAIFNFVISQLDYPNPKMEEDLPVLLRSLNCPFKVNKSALPTPATPHAWPTFVTVLHWLVQIASYNDHLASKSRSFGDSNSMDEYALQSYLHFIGGDDDAVDALDREFVDKLEQERNNLAENVKSLEKNAVELEARVEKLRMGPSDRELREQEKSVLEEDVKKFNMIIGEIMGRIPVLEKELEEKKELRVKEEEEGRIRKENEELKKTIQMQTFNSRDVERMKELQAVEGEIADAEIERNKYKEKCWDLDRTLALKFKEQEELAKECNKAVWKLKLGSDYQFVLNAKGSTPAEVMGIDSKSTLKLVLDSHADDINRSSVEKLEKLILLQQQSKKITARIEEKRNCVAQLHSRVGENFAQLEGQMHLVKQEMEEYIHRCVLEVQRMVEDVEVEAHNLNIVEREAAEVLKTSKRKQQEAIRESEEEIQKCAFKLFSLVDMVSKHKKYMECKISEMKTCLLETTNTISADYRASLPTNELSDLKHVNCQKQKAVQYPL
ncbi:LOW QUALITY PROTEIN: hypothetical protein BT93_G0616 [Corymbia citriodora subsp. variegata]|nr:LOW QUALITY PROTEIN: hypothetical protein BT93_G0616 [Corymbia citriodora subsp. variegata]